MRRIGIFITGVTVGALGSLLLAPKPGRESMRDARAAAENLLSQTEGIRGRVAGQATDLRDRVASQASEIAQGTLPIMEKVAPVVSGAVGHSSDEIKNKIDAARKIIADQVEKNASETQGSLSKASPLVAESINASARAAWENKEDR